MTAPTPGPDAVARDEVGEVGPMLRTADDLRQYEREGVRLDGSMGFAWWVDGDWITATDQYFSSKALIEDYGFVLVSFDPHLTPQPDGDVVEELAEVHGTAGPYPRPEESVQDFKERVARDFLASGLVVPVGEVADLRESLDIQTSLLEDARAALESVKDRMDEHAYDELSCPLSDGACDLETGGMIRSRRDRAVAQVAAVRAETLREVADELDRLNRIAKTSVRDLTDAERDEFYANPLTGGGDWTAARGAFVNWLRERAALDTAPASPTTDQRIEARQLSGEHVGKVVVLPDGTRGTLWFLHHAHRRLDDARFALLWIDESSQVVLAPSDVVTLIGGEE